MMLVLAFIACSAAQPDRCRNVELPWDGSMLQCQLFGQQAVAAWTEPRNLIVPRGWRCGRQEKQA